MKPFNPELLVLRRESLGLTQAELSDRLGISQAKLSKVEGGLVEPSEELVSDFAAELRRPREFFYEREPVYGPGVGEFYHRKRQSVGAKQVRQAHAQINEDLITLRRLLRSADLDTSGFDRLEHVEDFGPEEAARAVRAAWGLPEGPVRNVTRAIEDAGGVIILCSFPTPKIDAVSRWVPGLPPVFFVNRNLPGDRQRFTLSHELAHILLHHAPNTLMEVEADRFAAEFLLPKQVIKSQLLDASLSRLAALKPYWKVAMQALLVRASELNAISERKARHLWMRMGQLGYRKREPAELDIPQEQPSLLGELFELHRSSFGFSVAQLASLLLFTSQEVQARYGIQADQKPNTRLALTLVR